MKNLVIIIGTIILGTLIVSTLVLGGDTSLQGAATDLITNGVTNIKGIFD
ncbi:MAG: hypothetical protein RR495_03820 [Anaerovoracaceae bacterium]